MIYGTFLILATTAAGRVLGLNAVAWTWTVVGLPSSGLVLVGESGAVGV